MRKLTAVIVIVLIAIAGLIILKDPLIKTAVTVGTSSVIGAPVKIDSLRFSVLKQSIRIKGLKIFNPAGFPDGALLDIAEVSADYRPFDLIKGKLYFPLIAVDLKEMVIVKNKEGKLNVDALKVSQQAEKPRLDRVGYADSPLCSVAKKILKTGKIHSRGNDKDVANSG